MVYNGIRNKGKHTADRQKGRYKNMTWKQRILTLKAEFTGRKIEYLGCVYTVIDVDYNGAILIDLKANHTMTTAVYFEAEARKHLIREEANA